MTVEVVDAKEFPMQHVPKYDVLYKAVARLPRMGKGLAVRVSAEGLNLHKAAKRIHDYAKRRDIDIQTATADGFLYLRIAQRRQPETVLEPLDLSWRRKGQRKP